MSKKILVIAPHSDDAELGCGGYLAKQAILGAEITVVVMAVGTIRHVDSGKTVHASTRLDEAVAAGEVLGVKSVVLGFDGMDSLMDTLPMRDVIDKIGAAIVSYAPDEVLLPLPSAHQDHEVVYKAAIAACRPRPATRGIKAILAYEYPATGWGSGSEFSAGRGGMYVDITEVMPIKQAALNCHKSQMRDGQDLISTYAADALARLRGVESCCQYAELLHVIRMRA